MQILFDLLPNLVRRSCFDYWREFLGYFVVLSAYLLFKLICVKGYIYLVAYALEGLFLVRHSLSVDV